MERYKSIKFFIQIFSGNAVAQIITFASIPILTRYYEPQSYAALGIFISIVSTLAPSSTGKFDVASVVVRDKKVAGALIAAALWSTSILTALILVGCLFFIGFGGGAMVETISDIEILLLATGVFFAALNATLKNLATIVETYYAISLAVLSQAIVTLVVAVAAFYLRTSVNGLVLGFIAGSLCSFIVLLALLARHRDMIVLSSFSEIWSAARSHKTFPLFNASTSVFDGLFVWMPVYFLTVFFGPAEVGLFFLVNRLLVGPLSLIASSLSPLILKNSSVAISETGSAKQFFFASLIKLSFFGVIFALACMLLVPIAITYGLGTGWEYAETFIYILLPMIIFRFVVSTFSPIFSSSGRNDLAAIWKISGFCISFVIYSLFVSSSSVEQFLLVICLTEIFLYIAQLFLIFKSANQPAVL